MDSLNQQLAVAVKWLRNFYRMSQADLAKRSGVHIRTLRALEAGRKNSLTLAGAINLSKALGGRIRYCIVPFDNRLANALARGIPVRQKLVAAEGGSFSAEEAAEEIGISKHALLKRHQKGQLVAWRDERQQAFRFPVWQFQEHRVLNGIAETLKVLNAGDWLDDFGRMLFFLSTPGFLGGKRPLDCLREGAITKVIQAAQGYVGQPQHPKACRDAGVEQDVKRIKPRR